MVNKILSTELFISCFLYIDNVVVFDKITAEVIEYTRHVLDLIRAENLKVEGQNAVFF